MVRPFNTYGPFQKSSGEGGVVAIFCRAELDGADLKIYGDGTQTRDLLYVEDCADFIIQSATNDAAIGRTLNAGSGTDVSINVLAEMVSSDPDRIHHVEHIHPQCEIQRLRCENALANRLLGWKPKTPLEAGVEKTKQWIVQNDPNNPSQGRRNRCKEVSKPNRKK